MTESNYEEMKREYKRTKKHLKMFINYRKKLIKELKSIDITIHKAEYIIGNYKSLGVEE